MMRLGENIAIPPLKIKGIFSSTWLLFGCLVVIVGQLEAQTNNWVDYNQKYFKFPVAQDGVYRLDYTTLGSAFSSGGIDINTINPKNLQVWGRGKEQYILVQGENDLNFGTADFIELLAFANDGWFDTLIYDSVQFQNNPYHSLFNDTAWYFVTLNTSTSNKRMKILNDNNFTGLTVADYYLKEEIVEYTSSFFHGPIDGYGKGPTRYVEGKGWFGNEIRLNSSGYNSSVSNNFNTGLAFTGSGAPNAEFELVLASVNNPSVSPDHHFQVSVNGSNFVNELVDGYALRKYEFSLPTSSLGSTATIRLDLVNDLNSSITHRTVMSYMKIRYPKQTDFIGLTKEWMYFPATSTKRKLAGLNFGISSGYIYSVSDTVKRITVFPSGNGFEAVIPSGTERKMYLTQPTQNISVSTLHPINDNGSFINLGTAILDSSFVIVYHKAFVSSAQSYSSYRSGLAGGSFNVTLIDIDELYDQFAYGIKKHPSCFKGFSDYLIAQNINPKALLIIGKAVSDASQSARNNITKYTFNFVPTFGYPGSDNALTARIKQFEYYPTIPTGRIPATNNQQVLDYLNKVKEYESNHDESFPEQRVENKLWMKNMLHFGGGSSTGEQSEFRNYLNIYQDTIEDFYYGAKVDSFFKTTSAPVQEDVAGFITGQINNGISLMTFFGHASGTTWDISVDHPSTYDNQGKYPLALANSCFSGDIHQYGSLSASEEFVFEPSKGAIGFLASTHLGVPPQLHMFSSRFYTALGKTNYGKSIGKCIQWAIEDFSTGSTNLTTVATALEFTLNGDPSIVLNTHSKQDYCIYSNTNPNPFVFFSPANVTTDLDSFDVNLIVSNIGKGIEEEVEIEMTWIKPNGETEYKTTSLSNVYYQDTAVFTLGIDQVNSIGLNEFEFRVDPASLIPEITDQNNDIINPRPFVWISSKDLVPVYPYDHEVLPDFQDIILSASTNDPFAPERSYVFQIDTTDLYNSTQKQEYQTSSSGGVISWSPGNSWFQQFSDSTVFFFRSSPYNVDTSELSWREHSFQIISNERGWGQQHFFQKKNNDYSGINYNRSDRSFEFVQNTKSLRVNVWGNPQNASQYSQTEYRLDGVQQESNICNGQPAIMIAIIDSLTLEPWKTKKNLVDDGHSLGNGNDMNLGYANNCRSRQEQYFSYLISSTVQMDSLLELLTSNDIPNGHYLLAYTAVQGNFSTWNPQLISAFQNLGAAMIGSVGDQDPYIFFVKKGYPSTAQEVKGSSFNEYISMDATLFNNATQGYITTPKIGYAKSWESFKWKFSETSVNDEVKMSIFGIDESENEQQFQIISSPSGVDLGIQNLNAVAYPRLRIKTLLTDDSLQTPMQLERFHVLYQPEPELALNASVLNYFYRDTVMEGDSLKIAIQVKNVSQFQMDSFYVTYRMENVARAVVYDAKLFKTSLAPGTIFNDTAYIPTRGLEAQDHLLWMEVNERDSLWRPEQYHFNNMAYHKFHVKHDKINPLLDVTFDGFRIMDGDIVSAKPLIEFKLSDDNQFLVLDDPSDLEIYLTYPNGSVDTLEFTTLSLSGEMQYYAGTSGKNSSRLDYRPALTQDGIYNLKVQGKDVSGNRSGAGEYRISFEVINESTITYLMNYPNPFSTVTRFVFTLTGSELPDEMKIQIMTITGKIVREIMIDELQNMHIGKNITGSWDGTDEYGDLVANGVYLYRAIIKNQGEDVKRRTTSADNFFIKDFGKMYLMR